MVVVKVIARGVLGTIDGVTACVILLDVWCVVRHVRCVVSGNGVLLLFVGGLIETYG
jgi:hypothetical protein